MLVGTIGGNSANRSTRYNRSAIDRSASTRATGSARTLRLGRMYRPMSAPPRRLLAAMERSAYRWQGQYVMRPCSATPDQLGRWVTGCPPCSWHVVEETIANWPKLARAVVGETAVSLCGVAEEVVRSMWTRPYFVAAVPAAVCIRRRRCPRARSVRRALARRCSPPGRGSCRWSAATTTVDIARAAPRR